MTISSLAPFSLMVTTAHHIPLTCVLFSPGASILTGVDHHYPNSSGHVSIAFYDRRFRFPPFHPDYGQFIAEYVLPSLLSSLSSTSSGLCLHGGVPDWTIDAPTMAIIRAYLYQVLKQFPALSTPH